MIVKQILTLIFVGWLLYNLLPEELKFGRTILWTDDTQEESE